MLKGHKSKIDSETAPQNACKVRKTPEHFLLNCKEYDKDQAKLEKDIKKIFYKNNCHKMSITIEDLLGECDLSSQDAAIFRKKAERVYSGNRKRNLKLKHKNIVIKFFVLKFFIYLCIYLFFSFYFISISLLLLLEYTCIYLRSLNCLCHEDCLRTLVICMLVIQQKLPVTSGRAFSLHAN